MFVRLLPEQIAVRWDAIKHTIIESSPPYVDDSQEAMNNVLMSLLNGTLQCWVSVVDKQVDMIVTTCIEEDFHSRTRNLLIYSLFGVRMLTGKSWVEGFDTMRKYALGEGCSAIIGITKEEKISRVVERLGGDAGWRYIRIPVSDNPTL